MLKVKSKSLRPMVEIQLLGHNSSSKFVCVYIPSWADPRPYTSPQVDPRKIAAAKVIPRKQLPRLRLSFRGLIFAAEILRGSHRGNPKTLNFFSFRDEG